MESDAGTFVFRMLELQEGVGKPIDRIELQRYVNCLNKVYGGVSDAVLAELGQPGQVNYLPDPLAFLTSCRVHLLWKLTRVPRDCTRLALS